MECLECKLKSHNKDKGRGGEGGIFCSKESKKEKGSVQLLTHKVLGDNVNNTRGENC